MLGEKDGVALWASRELGRSKPGEVVRRKETRGKELVAQIFLWLFSIPVRTPPATTRITFLDHGKGDSEQRP